MSARDRMVEVLTDALQNPPEVYQGPSLPEAIARYVVDRLIESADLEGGLLIYQGAVRNVEIADRFGPSSWEITTEQHIQDVHSWENPSE